ncbi:LOG family protein [Streptomyces zagrosensis]|uniref:Cytokinin riboside 5'-monophosphate phosphoribohydrolase n=1 Tax=Streptomyces zagrosensis TaxID=1042984 RepID=A0A7W9QFE6_9ACTN|nr:TIGR00730 family Rossman fold protein [Streptomyces zagrosensis]MBB5938989.1 hypothetical protein [Streptomyces zagrosensis]
MDISDAGRPGGPRVSLCVFCGVSGGRTPRYARAADELGELIARRGHRLVYGAGGIGLMGALAHGAARHRGDILGVIPKFLRAREMGDELPRQQVWLTEDLLERKRVMIDRSDAFIALPGGYGTLDEVLEVISMAALGLPVGPLVLVDVDDDWRVFTTLVEDLFRRDFTRRTDLFQRAATPAEALDLAEAGLAPGLAATTTG